MHGANPYISICAFYIKNITKEDKKNKFPFNAQIAFLNGTERFRTFLNEFI
jgi:hypothetical protein